MSPFTADLAPRGPRDAEILDQRAKVLALVPKQGTGADTAGLFVSFFLKGMSCALQMSVVRRALARLGRVARVPLAGGESRNVAFVDGVPLEVLDLKGEVVGRRRRSEQLGGSPAIVVVGREGSTVVVVVDGPLELSRQPITEQASVGASEGPGALRIAGRLSDGTLLLSTEWLAMWVEASR